MGDIDPRERRTHTEHDAEQRWQERGNPPSQPAPKPLAFAGWMLYAIVGAIVLLAIIVLLFVHQG